MWRHQNRCVVFARFWFELGTMYLYRCVTMSVTTIPVMKVEPNFCLPKSDGTPMALFLRGAKTFVSLGMKRSGQNLCGDYIFSGHSATMFILMHSIIDNAPKSMKKLRIIVQIAVLSAILAISISHQVRFTHNHEIRPYSLKFLNSHLQNYYSIIRLTLLLLISLLFLFTNPIKLW